MGRRRRRARRLNACIVLFLVVAFQGFSWGAERPGVLAGNTSPQKLKEVLLDQAAWHPFPKISDRGAWADLPEAVRAAHVKLGEAYLKTGWETPRASVFLEYIRNGNRSRYEAVSFGRRVKLAGLTIAECVEGKNRFLDEIVDGIWTICEETYWGVPAHVGAQKRGSGLPDVTESTVDLFAAETGMLLSWVDYLLGERLDPVSPLVRERIHLEVTRRILAPNLERDDFWWMGIGGRTLNNWTPWICSNWLAATLLLEKDAERRARSVFKIMQCLDRFLSFYPADGGCDEGPSYWDRAGGSLFDCLDLLAGASNGRIRVYDQPLIQEIGRYIARAYIHDPYYINFADAPARVEANAGLIYRYGRAIGDQDLAGFGAFLAHRQHLGEGAVAGSFGVLGRSLPTLFSLRELAAAEGREPSFRDVWLPGLQVMAARSREGAVAGLYVAAKGGNNAESHNHNDVGNFIVYADGLPVLIDVGVETYTAKTFSSQRYDIWTMQSAWHNLPTINGAMQKDGREFAARDVWYSADAEKAELSLDLAKCYPSEAGILSWVRTLALERGKQIILHEKFRLQQEKAPLVLTLMSCRKPQPGANGRILLSDTQPPGNPPPVSIDYDAEFFRVDVETIPINDERLRASWGEKLYRILLTAVQTPAHGEYTIRISR
jgi:hypothetical protein